MNLQLLLFVPDTFSNSIWTFGAKVYEIKYRDQKVYENFVMSSSQFSVKFPITVVFHLWSYAAGLVHR